MIRLNKKLSNKRLIIVNERVTIISNANISKPFKSDIYVKMLFHASINMIENKCK